MEGSTAGELTRRTGSSIVELNQAASELLRRLDRDEDARAAYEPALELVEQQP